MGSDVRKAIQILKEGGIVIFPTDTAFGIGCRIDDEKAVERLFKIRKRPKTQSVPVLVDTVKMAQDYLLPIPKEVITKLIEPFWPGALTIVLPCKVDKVLPLVRGNGQTLGVRIPNHSTARAIIRGVSAPILGPSANFHREKTPYEFEDLDSELIQLVDYVLPGKTFLHQASTVIDCSQKPWRILREGAISLRQSMSILYIDTSNNKQIKVGLRVNKEENWIKQKIGIQKAQVVLPMLQKLLEKNKMKLGDLDEVKVNVGPGSFTGLRVGIAIANALSFALKIPVNKKKLGKFVEPVY